MIFKLLLLEILVKNNSKNPPKMVLGIRCGCGGGVNA